MSLSADTGRDTHFRQSGPQLGSLWAPASFHSPPHPRPRTSSSGRRTRGWKHLCLCLTSGDQQGLVRAGSQAHLLGERGGLAQPGAHVHPDPGKRRPEGWQPGSTRAAEGQAWRGEQGPANALKPRGCGALHGWGQQGLSSVPRCDDMAGLTSTLTPKLLVLGPLSTLVCSSSNVGTTTPAGSPRRVPPDKRWAGWAGGRCPLGLGGPGFQVVGHGASMASGCNGAYLPEWCSRISPP